ncbi:MAG TPA: carotenoid biosynthesis protein [Anaerolineae bacterium]|nr:carotenoid biosynthesis protein [Anaerolineae bacterium]
MITVRWLLPAMALLAFLACLAHSYRFGKRDPLFFVVAVAFALAMEWAQLLFLDYQYVGFPPRWRGVPLVIPLGWSAVFYLSDEVAAQVLRGLHWARRVFAATMVTMVLLLALELAGLRLGWWTWAEEPAMGGLPLLVPFQAFSAGFTFLLGVHLVAQMGLTDARLRLRFLVLTLFPLLFVHAGFVYLVRQAMRWLF